MCSPNAARIATPEWLIPDCLHNGGNYIISLGAVTKWLAAQAEALGVEIFPGFAAAEVLFGDDGAVKGVATGNLGIGKDGQPHDGFQLGMELHARYTVFAEGARGHLGKQVIARYRARRRPRRRRAMPSASRSCGRSTRPRPSPAWWCTPPAGRWTAAPTAAASSTTSKATRPRSGYVTGLDYQNPWLSPFEEMQRWKTHPAIRKHLEGGKRLGYGARAICAGGLLALPKLVFPGGALVGCDAGTLNAARIKGSHAAIKTGMLCAEALYEAVVKDDRRHDELTAYPEAFRASWLWDELERRAQLQAMVQEGQLDRRADDRHRALVAAQAGHQEPAVDDPQHRARPCAAASRRPSARRSPTPSPTAC